MTRDAAPVAAKAPAAARSSPPRLNRSDREFLPAALEILETPPSPIRMGLMVVICSFIVVAVAWSYFSRIDIIATASGKLEPTGRVKVVQPLETSRVVSAKVENGTHVRAGDILVELDQSEADADVAGLTTGLASYQAEALRRQKAIDAATSNTSDSRLVVDWPKDIPSGIRHREEEIYAADVLQLSSQIASLKAQAEQKLAEQQRLTSMIAAESALIDTLSQRVEMRKQLIQMNAGSKGNLLDATEAVQTQKTTLAQQQGQLEEAKTAMQVFTKDINRTRDTFVAENAQKRADAERQADDISERLAKAVARLKHMTLRSPIDGIVQASAITTVGQIVTSGQEIMRIVPEGAVLEVQCYLPNKDIGFVKEGDHAILKVESFPFTRYGTVDAVVTRIARDAIPEPDAEQIEKGTMRAGQSDTQGGGERTQNLVFPVTLRLVQSEINVDGVHVPLGAGMTVIAEIRTGSRRILEYVLSPLAKLGSEAMRER